MTFKKGNQLATTYKREIVLALIQEMPKASTMSLARLLLKNNPLDFENVEQCRTAVRRYRGENGKNNSPVINVGVRTETEKKQFMKKTFDLPESDYEKSEPYVIPKLQNNVLVLSDIHIPYQDNKALELALNYGLENKVNAIYLNGDTIDMYQGSRFIKDRRLRDLAGELEMTRQFLKMLKDTFNCPIYFKIGNHEVRWMSYLMRNAKSFLEVFDFSYSEAYDFDGFNIQEVPEYAKMKLGHLNVIHGHEAGGGISVPVNFARTLWLRFADNVAAGHSHRSSEHVETNINEKVFGCWGMGCLCSLRPGFRPLGNKWNHGFGFVEVYKDRNFKFKNIKIGNGEIY